MSPSSRESGEPHEAEDASAGSSPQPQGMELPEDTSLPLFVYGALKPGMPAFEQIRSFVASHTRVTTNGRLYVRDGIPLLHVGQEHGNTTGALLAWRPGKQVDAYKTVCQFEPRKHYKWHKQSVSAGLMANVLVDLHPTKGNPQPVEADEWRLFDDPAFSHGLKVVRGVLIELKNDQDDGAQNRFFRAQMAYLLLWSILERLSGLSFGTTMDPTQRAISMHSLPGMSDIVARRVGREDSVTDSRDPAKSYRLNGQNTKKCFQYYYQVRSNLSHRGKGAYSEFNKVHGSLEELTGIVEEYLASLNAQSLSCADASGPAVG